MRTPAKEKKPGKVLPPLEVFIHQPGYPVRKVLLSDPRAAFCTEFNQQAAQFGARASINPARSR